MKRYAGIDIGGTYIKYAIYEMDGSIHRKWKEETRLFMNKNDLYDHLCDALQDEELAFVGMSVPGVIDAQGNVNSKAGQRICCMYGTNVHNEMGKRMNIPVRAINDAKAAGYYEARWGSGKASESCAVVTLGTGIGGCFCLHGDVLQGYNGFAGELSSLPMGEGKRWCEVGSVRALCDAYNQESGLHEEGITICERYIQGEVLAKQHLEAWVKQVALGCVSIAVCLNPEVICIGGGISSQTWLIELLTKAFKEACHSYTQCDVVQSKLVACSIHNDANIAGAIAYTKECIKWNI